MIEEFVCQGCGLVGLSEDVAGHAYMPASPYCWRLYGELLAREYNNPAYMRVHRWTVDAYAAQHSGEEDRRAILSVWLRVVSLYLPFEQRCFPGEARKAVQYLARSREFNPLPAPAVPQRLMAADVLRAENADRYQQLAERWARSVWRAWSSAHGQAATIAQGLR